MFKVKVPTNSAAAGEARPHLNTRDGESLEMKRQVSVLLKQETDIKLSFSPGG